MNIDKLMYSWHATDRQTMLRLIWIQIFKFHWIYLKKYDIGVQLHTGVSDREYALRRTNAALFTTGKEYTIEWEEQAVNNK